MGWKKVEVTEVGFLTDQDQWNEAIANRIAESASIQLTKEHWEIVYFIRDYYTKYNHLPNTRVFTKAIRTQLGEAKGNSRYLYRLFPEGPLKYACKIGGLPKPTSCI